MNTRFQIKNNKNLGKKLKSQEFLKLSTNENREKILRYLKNNPNIDVLIIGGGINGVGTFRDLALQGVNVLLIEKGDYCQGASGASSHMIHGGIRYLENGEFRLVKESIKERNILLKAAPHYIKPLRTTIPIFKIFSGIMSAPRRFLTHKKYKKHKERGAFLIKIGLIIYDFFSNRYSKMPKHQFLNKKESLKQLPKLNENIKYTATYFDASVHNPERMILDLLQDAKENNILAKSLNYLSIIRIDKTNKNIVILKDEISGKKFSCKIKILINTSGSLVDKTNNLIGLHTDFMGGTKGSHIVIKNNDLLKACAKREIFFEYSDRRIVLIYPIEDRVLIGTTDVNIKNNEKIVCSNEEINYFFQLVKHIFPNIKIKKSDIVYTFSGVRPLPKNNANLQPGFISRDYKVYLNKLGSNKEQLYVISLVGGKWTTFRAISEKLCNKVIKILDINRKVFTEKLIIGGGRDFPKTKVDQNKWINDHTNYKLNKERVRLLLNRYGTKANFVINFINLNDDKLLKYTKELSKRELEYMIRYEQVQHVMDILIRRTSLAFRGLVNKKMIVELANELAIFFSWSKKKIKKEIKYSIKIMTEFHGVDCSK